MQMWPAAFHRFLYKQFLLLKIIPTFRVLIIAVSLLSNSYKLNRDKEKHIGILAQGMTLLHL